MTPSPYPSRPRSAPRVLPAALAVCAALVAAVPGVATAAPARVAVMDFRNNTSERELDALGKGLRSMLTTDLAQVGEFTVVERERMADIQSELELSQSKLVDRGTAVKVGKLVAARYVIIGSFVIAGERMRIDGQVVAVEKGTHVAAAEVTGERDAFFELEKELVKKLVAGVGIKLRPKERAEIGKVHTADFEAFRKFSEGIDHFDAQRYEQARRALQAAATIDTDFELARVTLAEYERLIAAARSRATDARTAEVELWRLERDQRSRWGAALLGRLFDIAAAKGRGKGRGADQIDRLVAIHLIASLYEQGYQDGPLQPMRQHGDQFALERTAENMRKTYWASARPAFPKLAPMIGGPLYAPPPEDMAGFDKYFAGARKRAMAEAKSFGGDVTNYTSGLGANLHFDMRQRAALYQELYELATRQGRDQAWTEKAMLATAQVLRDVLELDASTRWLERLTRTSRDARMLKKAADELEENRDVAAFLSSVPKSLRSLAREYLIQRGPNKHGVRDAAKLFTAGTLTPELARAVQRQREHWCSWRGAEYCVVGGEPMWLRQGKGDLGTGRRDDRLRTGAVTYLREREGRRDKPALTIYGTEARRRFKLGVTLRYQPSKLWRLAASERDRERFAALGRDGQRARVSVLFGIENVETQNHRDLRTKVETPAAPMTGWAFRIEADEIRLVRFQEQGNGNREKEFDDVDVIERWKVALDPAKPIPIELELSGTHVTLRVAGKRYRAKNPASKQAGFVGFEFHGTGYAALTKLSLK
ncbi:CsgG/HfaB family protein [Haliangium sp.]|uniref:CsgG/HfaB family protein n=1 Tax=Haliangium sp. TaxID=2663208 RepID=UPI003D142188